MVWNNWLGTTVIAWGLIFTWRSLLHHLQQLRVLRLHRHEIVGAAGWTFGACTAREGGRAGGMLGSDCEHNLNAQGDARGERNRVCTEPRIFPTHTTTTTHTTAPVCRHLPCLVPWMCSACWIRHGPQYLCIVPMIEHDGANHIYGVWLRGAYIGMRQAVNG